MTILLCFDLLGILFSFLAFFFLLLDFSLPLNTIAIALNIGIGVAFFSRLSVTKGLRQGKDWFYDKSLRNICPFWLKVFATITISYGIVNCFVYLSRAFTKVSVTMTKQDDIIASKHFFIGVFSLIMAYYTVEFLLIYLYKILKDRQLQQSKIEGIAW